MTEQLCALELADRGAIATIILSDPATINAMSPEMGDAFCAIVGKLVTSSDLRAVIIRGAGGNFSIGGHRDMLSKLANDPMSAAERKVFMLAFYDRWLSVLDLPVPVIAAIEGECIGVASVFAFASDIALADETANFQITFANLGLYPGMAMMKLVPDALARQHAALTLLAAEPFDGREAARLGVVARAVPKGTVHDAALALARRIADNAPETVRSTTKALRVTRADLTAQLASDAEAQAESYASTEFRNRIARYLPDHYGR